MDGIKKTYSEQIAEYVKRLILDGALSPGDPVREAVIAEELSISRAPVREALQQLVLEGLVVSVPQKRKHVAALTSAQIKNSYFTGGVLEGAAVAASLERYDATDIAALEDVLQRIKQKVEAGASLSELTPLDTEFHQILFAKIQNDLVIELCRRSCQGISKFLLYKHWRKVYTPQEFYERHKTILDVFKTGDSMAVEQTLREHYLESGRRMARFGVDVYSEESEKDQPAP